MNNMIYDMLNKIDVGIVILDEDLEILLWNNFMEHKAGLSGKKLMGKRIFDVLPNLNKNYFRESIVRVLTSGCEMFFSAAMHGKLINDEQDLNIKINRLDDFDKKFIMLEFIDVTNQFVRIKQLKEYINKLYLLNKELKEKEKTIQKLAYYDSLTGTANRTLFYKFAEKFLSNAKRTNSILGLLMIDIDNFKNINDTYGHKAGDDALVEVANMFKSCVRKNDVVARFGGDEFLVLLSNIKNYKDYNIIISRILNKRNKILSCDGDEINISLSIGASFYPHDGSQICDLIMKADKAMYRVKKAKHLRVSDMHRI